MAIASNCRPDPDEIPAMNQPNKSSTSEHFIIGLTGGIGSGKSAAAALFRERNVLVIDADQVARDVVEPGSPALAAIAERHGQQILLADGALDRARLREIVFADDSERHWLEQLTHPLIGELMFARLHGPGEAGEAPYRMLESPLLFETEQKMLTHRTLLVDIPTELQIERAAARDNSSAGQIAAIIEAQMPRNEKLALADDVIDNSGSLAELEQQVDALHARYCELANNALPGQRGAATSEQ